MSLSLRNIKALRWIQVIIIFLFFFAICYIFTAAILMNGLGLSSDRDCFTAVITCLVFYFGNKMIMYIFLVRYSNLSPPLVNGR